MTEATSRRTEGLSKNPQDRMVPFPTTFKEVLAMHIDRMREKQAVYLFESNRKHKYTDRGVRKLVVPLCGSGRTAATDIAAQIPPLFAHLAEKARGR